MINLTVEQEIIIAKVSKQLNIPFGKVREVFESDFRTMVNKIREFNVDDESTHHVFLLPNFGKFALNYKRARKHYDGFKNKNTNPEQE
jgi:nucleoid DNA-binding protein